MNKTLFSNLDFEGACLFKQKNNQEIKLIY